MRQFENNPRTLSKKQAARLRNTMARYGDLSGIVHDLRTDQIISGNQRANIGALMRLTPVITETFDPPLADGTVSVGYFDFSGNRFAYRAVTGWNDAELLEANLVANAAGGSWDWDILPSFDADLLGAVGFDEDFLKDTKRAATAMDALLKSEAGEPGDAEPQVDRAAELQEKWQVKRGDLWQIGDHRLLCGDSTVRADVERVMSGERAQAVVTDPPYGITALGGRRQTHETQDIKYIENDDLRGDALVDFLCVFLENCITLDNASFYICYGWKSQSEFTQAIKRSNLFARATITWVKNVFGLSAKNNYGYRPQTEFIYFSTRTKEYDWIWNGGGTQSDAWIIDRPDRVGNHPTCKPVELMEKCVLNSTSAVGIVYEPFAGSGTTGIACQNLGRRARMIEISPQYCSVILERFATAFPGIDIHKVSNGTPD